MTNKNKSQMITIDDVEYNVDDLTEEQKILVNHCIDLDRKLGSTQFQMDQLRVGKDAFFSMLKASLDKGVTDVEANG